MQDHFDLFVRTLSASLVTSASPNIAVSISHFFQAYNSITHSIPRQSSLFHLSSISLNHVAHSNLQTSPSKHCHKNPLPTLQVPLQVPLQNPPQTESSNTHLLTLSQQGSPYIFTPTHKFIHQQQPSYIAIFPAKTTTTINQTPLSLPTTQPPSPSAIHTLHDPPIQTHRPPIPPLDLPRRSRNLHSSTQHRNLEP